MLAQKIVFLCAVRVGFRVPHTSVLRVGVFAALTLLTLPAATRARTSSGALAPPANGAGAYATHHYRNLFAESGHSNRAISKKINAAYAQLFHGDPQTQSVFFHTGRNANGPLAYLTDVLERIVAGRTKITEIEALLPWNWRSAGMAELPAAA